MTPDHLCRRRLSPCSLMPGNLICEKYFNWVIYEAANGRTFIYAVYLLLELQCALRSKLSERTERDGRGPKRWEMRMRCSFIQSIYTYRNLLQSRHFARRSFFCKAHYDHSSSNHCMLVVWTNSKRLGTDQALFQCFGNHIISRVQLTTKTGYR
ncbi:hypothetical protein Tcan_00679, partial [Toxocara canis]